MLKYIVIFIVLTVVPIHINAQQDSVKYWNFTGSYTFQANQSSFTNWSAGGQNFIGFDNNPSLTINYQKAGWYFTTSYAQNYGISKVGENNRFRKTQDLIAFHTKLAWQFSRSSNSKITLFTDLFTQAAPGYAFSLTDYDTNFFSPAFITEGIAYEYLIPSVNLKMIFTPFAGKQTVVTDNGTDGRQFGLGTTKGVLIEAGIYFNVSFEKEILKRTQLTSTLFLFTDYIKKFGNIDVRWGTGLAVLINNWLSVNINSNLIYNDDIELPTFKDINDDGIKELIGSGPKVQFTQSFGLGLNLSYSK